VPVCTKLPVDQAVVGLAVIAGLADCKALTEAGGVEPPGLHVPPAPATSVAPVAST